MPISKDDLATVLSFAKTAAPYLLTLINAKGEKGAIEEIKKLAKARRAARDERVRKKFKPRRTWDDV